MTYPYQPQVPMDGPAPGVRYGPRLSRFIAYLVDGFIMNIIVWPFFLVGMMAFGGSISPDGNIGAGSALFPLLLLVGVVLMILYKPFFWSRSGQTPGYKMMGLKLVRASDGGLIGFGTGIVRLIGYLISGVVFYLGFIWILVDGKRQGWHDKIAGTVVIAA